MFKKYRRNNTNQSSDEGREREISPERARQKTFDRAVNLLTYKPRSINELRERLLEKDWTTSEIVEGVIEKLREYNYLNDETFARNYAASKLRQKPVGRRVLKQRLTAKKLDKSTIDETLEKTFEETPEE